MLNVVKCFQNVTSTYILREGEILIVSFFTVLCIAAAM